MSDALRSAMGKCARRLPGDSVTLTDGEIFALLTEYERAGAEGIAQSMTTLAFAKMRRERDAAITALREMTASACETWPKGKSPTRCITHPGRWPCEHEEARRFLATAEPPTTSLSESSDVSQGPEGQAP